MKSFPVALKRPHEIAQHGETRVDDYYWMRDKEDPETIKRLRAESDYLDEMTRHIKPLQEKLFNEMKARIKETDSSVPEKRGEYFYYKRHEEGKQYPIFCRKRGTLDAAEEILLDQNQLAEGKSFCSVSGFEVSPDGKKLAYGVDWDGAEEYTLFIKDLTNGELYPEFIEKTLGSVYDPMGIEWGNDSKTVFYVTLNDSQRPEKLFRHKIGTDLSEDALLYHEEDESFFLYFYKTRDDAYVMTQHVATNTSEARFIDANHPEGELKVVQPRVEGLEYYVAHHQGKFLIMHNGGAKNFKVSVAPVENCGRENWKDFIPHREDVFVEAVNSFADFIVVNERDKDGLRQMRLSAADGASGVRYIPFPESAYTVTLDVNPEFETNIVRLNYSSFVTPDSTIDYHVDTGEWEVKKEAEIPSGYDKSQYVSERVRVTAPDGTEVPMSIVYKKGLKKDGNNPALLYGYGAYGAIVDPWFSPGLFSLLDRGFVHGIAHIRGGYDLGHDWYENGKMLNKKNSFTDFIACAEYLIAEGFTSREKLAAEGASAGGLLVSACTTMRPDLFKAVVCRVPFVDVVTTMSDPTIPLTTLEYTQWGNPERKEHYDYLMSYSPYDNICRTAYPDIFLTAGFNDPRVAFWEPAKFAAKLREMKTNDSLVLFYVNYDSGHAGASGRYDYLKELARYYAFLIDRLDVS